MNPSQLADNARQLQISDIRESHERTLIKIIRDLVQQSTLMGSDYLGFDKYGAKTHQKVLQTDRDNCKWVDQMEVSLSHRKLKRFSTWLKMQSVFQEPNLENNMTQERMTRLIKQLDEEKLFAEIQESKELDQRRKQPWRRRTTR